MDAELAYLSKEKISQSDSVLSIVLGNRSNRHYGPALIDSIRVYEYSEPIVGRLTNKSGDHDP